MWGRRFRQTAVQWGYFCINTHAVVIITLYNKWLAKSFPVTPFPAVFLFCVLLQAASDGFCVPDAMNYSVKGAL